MKNLNRIIPIIIAICLLAASALAHPGSGILVDRLGQIYFIDSGSGVWSLDMKGSLSHLSPLRNHWIALDPNNRFTGSRLPTDPRRDWVITAAGSNPTVLISTDFPLVIGPDGDLYYPSVREKNVRILRLGADGQTTTFATLPPSVAGTPLGWINGLTRGPDGSVYYTENNAIRRVARNGSVTTIATVTPLPRDAAIPGVESRPYLRGLKVDANGAVYVADSGDARVLKVTPDGKVTTLLQLESPWAPTDVAVFGDIVYVLEYSHTPGHDRLEWMPRVRKIEPPLQDPRSKIQDRVILTVDQMPGARSPKPPATPVSQNISKISLWDLIKLPFSLFG
jgi:hypothetical protein